MHEILIENGTMTSTTKTLRQNTDTMSLGVIIECRLSKRLLFNTPQIQNFNTVYF
jgi:hypothetical protein